MRFQDQQRALQAAQAYRDALLALMPSYKVFGARATVPDGGVAGVQRRLLNGKYFWCAKIKIDGKVRTRMFSVLKYGEMAAQRSALEVRAAWLKEARFEEMVKPGPSQDEIDQIAREIRIRFGEGPPPKASGFAGFRSRPMYGITRYESNAHGKCGAWTVVLVRRSIRHKKTFYDHSHGGKDAGLLKAQAYRDDVLTRVEPLKKRELHETVPSNNSSGVPGVHLNRTGKGVRNAWVASICTDGKTQTKCFSIPKYGEDRAFELAVHARKEMVDSVHGYRTPSPALKEWVASLPPD